jgi:hypothetical protein
MTASARTAATERHTAPTDGQAPLNSATWAKGRASKVRQSKVGPGPWPPEAAVSRRKPRTAARMPRLARVRYGHESAQRCALAISSGARGGIRGSRLSPRGEDGPREGTTECGRSRTIAPPPFPVGALQPARDPRAVPLGQHPAGHRLCALAVRLGSLWPAFRPAHPSAFQWAWPRPFVPSVPPTPVHCDHHPGTEVLPTIARRGEKSCWVSCVGDIFFWSGRFR